MKMRQRLSSGLLAAFFLYFNNRKSQKLPRGKHLSPHFMSCKWGGHSGAYSFVFRLIIKTNEYRQGIVPLSFLRNNSLPRRYRNSPQRERIVPHCFGAHPVPRHHCSLEVMQGLLQSAITNHHSPMQIIRFSKKCKKSTLIRSERFLYSPPTHRFHSSYSSRSCR